MFDNLFKTNQTTTKTTQPTQTGGMFSNLFTKKEETTPFQTVVKLQGGGVYTKGATPEELVKTERTDYGGLPTKKGYERADIVPVSLGGVNAAPENITYEPYSLTEKVKDFANKVYNSKLFSVIFNDTKNKINVLKQVAGTDILPKEISAPIKQITAKEYIPQTETDKYLKNEILPAYKSGKMSLQEARAKTVSFLKTEQEGIKQGTMANLPSAFGETVKDTFGGLFSTGLKAVRAGSQLASTPVAYLLDKITGGNLSYEDIAKTNAEIAKQTLPKDVGGQDRNVINEAAQSYLKNSGYTKTGKATATDIAVLGLLGVSDLLGDPLFEAPALSRVAKAVGEVLKYEKVGQRVVGNTEVVGSAGEITKLPVTEIKGAAQQIKEGNLKMTLTPTKEGQVVVRGYKTRFTETPNFEKVIEPKQIGAEIKAQASAVEEPKTPFQLLAEKAKTGEVPSIEVPKEPTTPFSQIHEQLQAEKAKEFKPTEDPLIQEAKKYKSEEEFWDWFAFKKKDPVVDGKSVGKDFAELSPLVSNRKTSDFLGFGEYKFNEGVLKGKIGAGEKLTDGKVNHWKERISKGERPVIIVEDKPYVSKITDHLQGGREYDAILEARVRQGHSRLEAYKQLGIKEVPVVYKSQLTDIWNKANKNVEIEPLIQEAKKYKSAEEFVKAQGTPVYRGGEKFTGDVGERGLPLTTDKNIAETFAREKKAFRENPAGQIMGLNPDDIVLEEYVISPSAKIATKKDIPNNVFEAYKKANPVTEPEIAEPIISKWARDNGFDAVDFSTLGKTSAKEAEIKILNKDVLKTKSQLTDIWNKAQEKPTTEPIVEAKKQPSKPVKVEKGKEIPQTKVSGVAKNIEAKAIEQGFIDKGYTELAEYGGSNFKKQAEIGSRYSIEQLEGIAKTGELPEGMKPATPLSILEDVYKNNPEKLIELAKSPLTSRISESASEVSLSRMREKGGAVETIKEVIKRRQSKAKEKIKSETKKIKEEIKKVNTKDVWSKFIDEITC